MTTKSDLKPIPSEEKYVDEDKDSGSYGIFGVDSGFCYSTHLSPEDAEDELKKEVQGIYS